MKISISNGNKKMGAILTACGANPAPVKNGVKINAPKAGGGKKCPCF